MKGLLSFGTLAIGILVSGPSVAIADTVLLKDEFSGSSVNTDLWHIPTWTSPTDGTYIGQTQFRVTQNSPLPTVSGGKVSIPVQSYNPTGFSFYGTELITNQSFNLGKEIDVKVRAKMLNSKRGIVGGIFLYQLEPGSNTLHDEIDFELVTNFPDKAQTNIYANEPLGTGHPQFVSYPSGSITDYHMYEVKWRHHQVSWYIDGQLVRTTTSHVPKGPMSLYLNDWVPASSWVQAYNPNLRPAKSPSQNVVLDSMYVDSVLVQALP